MNRFRRSSFAVLALTGLVSGCGKGDGKPPPGASEASPPQNPAGEFTPPDVDLGAPKDVQGGPSKPAEAKAAPNKATPPAKQEK